jgi:hypothetical protein
MARDARISMALPSSAGVEMTPHPAEALERVLTASAKNVDSQSGRKSQENRILWLLEAAWPNWVPAPELSKISLQYGRAIHSLRGRGWLISNRIESVGGVRHGSFRLGSRPIPPSKELRRGAGLSPDSHALNQKQGTESLFGDLRPERYPD